MKEEWPLHVLCAWAFAIMALLLRTSQNLVEEMASFRRLTSSTLGHREAALQYGLKWHETFFCLLRLNALRRVDISIIYVILTLKMHEVQYHKKSPYTRLPSPALGTEICN